MLARHEHRQVGDVKPWFLQRKLFKLILPPLGPWRPPSRMPLHPSDLHRRPEGRAPPTVAYSWLKDEPFASGDGKQKKWPCYKVVGTKLRLRKAAKCASPLPRRLPNARCARARVRPRHPGRRLNTAQDGKRPALASSREKSSRPRAWANRDGFLQVGPQTRCREARPKIDPDQRNDRNGTWHAIWCFTQYAAIL